jgi:hypothetical protein
LGKDPVIDLVSEIASNGFAAGIDFSQTMLEQASKLNASAIESGLVEMKDTESASKLGPASTKEHDYAP